MQMEQQAAYKTSPKQNLAVDLLEAVDSVSALTFSLRPDGQGAKAAAHLSLRNELIALRRSSLQFLTASMGEPGRVIQLAQTCKAITSEMFAADPTIDKPASGIPSPISRIQQLLDGTLARIALVSP